MLELCLYCILISFLRFSLYFSSLFLFLSSFVLAVLFVITELGADPIVSPHYCPQVSTRFALCPAPYIKFYHYGSDSQLYSRQFSASKIVDYN